MGGDRTILNPRFVETAINPCIFSLRILGRAGKCGKSTGFVFGIGPVVPVRSIIGSPTVVVDAQKPVLGTGFVRFSADCIGS